MSFDPHELDRSYARGGGDTLGQYVGKTFLWMMVGLLITFGVSILAWSTGLAWRLYVSAPGVQLVLLVGILVISITLSARIERMAVGTAVTLFLVYSALFGFTVSLYLLLFELPSVMLVFLLTAVYFGALAAYGFFTKADLSRIGPILFAGLLFLIVFAVISLFIPGLTYLDRVVSFVAIAVFLGYTAYDTQKIKAYYHYYAGDPDLLAKASIFSALQLYLDFLNLFVRLLSILGKRRS